MVEQMTEELSHWSALLTLNMIKLFLLRSRTISHCSNFGNTAQPHLCHQSAAAQPPLVRACIHLLRGQQLTTTRCACQMIATAAFKCDSMLDWTVCPLTSPSTPYGVLAASLYRRHENEGACSHGSCAGSQSIKLSALVTSRWSLNVCSW